MNTRLFPRLLCPLLLAAPHPTLANDLPPANEATLVLVNDPAFNRLNLTLAVAGLGSDSDVSTITGNLDVRLDIDPATGRSPEFTILESSTIEGTAVAFKISVFLLGTVLDVASSTIHGTVLTTTAPGVIDPATGEGDAAQHEVRINQGTVSGYARNPLSGERTDINVDFATDPATGAGDGTIAVTLAPTTTDATRAYYDVTMLLPVNISEVLTDPDNPTVSATFTATGTIKAAGQVSVPLSDYLAWTESQGIPGADPDADSNNDGISDGMLWALGLELADNPRPHLPKPDPDNPREFQLELPAGGSGGPLTVEGSDTMEPDSWLPLDPAELSPSANPLPPGTTGVVTIAPAAMPLRFVRLRADP